ncbi:MAG: hypothetical protein AAGI22_00380 [Planctomycetota bacterium]
MSLAASAAAQNPDVAIVAAASGDLANCRYTDVQSYLNADGRFGNVDIIDCITQTPTLGDLTPYDAILTWTNVSYIDAVALGDVFADYVDAGGAVVVGVFATTTTTVNRSLDGRWITGGYEVIEPRLGNMSGFAQLGTVLQPGHPTMVGVNSLSATSAFRPTLAATTLQGSVVSEWDDGAILVAVGATNKRVDLGLYPPSNNCSGSFWDFAGDGDTLIANSLVFAAGGSVGVGTNYCMANDNSTGNPAMMSASGSPVASVNDLTLVATDLPNNAFGFFLTSQAQGFTPNPGGSSGNLCLSGSIGRYVGPGQIQNSGLVGEIELTVDLTMHPQPMGFVSIMSGETWNFTAWFRDSMGGSATSNFADGLEIDFL